MTYKEYMMSNLWQFSPIPCIEESAFNKVLERFYNFGISGLVRENIQNSLDGRLPGSTQPVMVTIKTGTIQKESIPGLEEIKERINTLQGRNSYTKETIEHMRKKMNEADIHYISFEDANTKGLKGANNGQSNLAEDTWSIYAYNKGVHTEEEDESVEQSRGGSHGIGKIASNAASDLYMMYFANCDEEGNQHLGGTIQLIEHQYKGNFYRSTGYFTDIKQIDAHKSKFYPFENHFDEVFCKDTRGLKIIIPFLREQFNNENEIIKSVCDSFFMSILQNKLQVIINDQCINSSTIQKYIKNEAYYIQELENMKEDFTPLYFDTYLQQEPMALKIADSTRDYHFNLYFNYNEGIPKGRVAIIRTIGMKIEDKKIKGNVNKPFNAVLIPATIAEDAFLKSLENESHTELSFEHIKDQKLQRSAKRFINNISKEIAKVIDEAIKKNNPTDGVMDTKDILYMVENQFKQDLSKSTATMRLNQGDKKQEVVKVKVQVPKKTDRKNNKGTGTKPKKGLKKVDHPREKNDDRILFSAHPDMVERVIIYDKEFLKFDFSQSEEAKKARSCNISLAVVDGMGVEYTDEFNIEDSYEKAIDKITGKPLEIEAHLIKNVKINKNTALIELKLKEHFNKALKFVYFVEV